jgi:hypothetical protein
VKQLAETQIHNDEDQPTCGKGVAANSIVPALLGELVAAQGKNLEVHMQALDLTDPNSKMEYDAYQKLVEKHRNIAAQLKALANEMASYHDLPMGRHDMAAMTTPTVLQAFERYVHAKQELLGLLQKTADEDRQMLEQMHSMGAQ